MNFKKIGASLLAMSMAAAFAVAPATASKAATIGGGTDTVVYTDSFANRDTTTNPLSDDELKVQASETLAEEGLPTTVKINLKKNANILSGVNIDTLNTNSKILDANAKTYKGICDVTSSSSKLKIKVTGSGNASNSVDLGYNYISIKAYANKAGTYTVNYNLTYYDVNNTLQKEARSIKVIAKEYKPFSKVTFAGKSLWYDKNAKSKYIYKDNNFTTKKSGKLVVKAAKGYKINKIEVGSYESKTVSAADYFESQATTETDTTTTTSSYSGSLTTVKDSNDYNLKDSYGNPIECKWKTVKSGKKVKLSNILAGRSKANYTYTSTTTNKYSGLVSTSTTTTKYNYRKGASAPTYIRITYTDSSTGEVHQWTQTINKLIKK